MNSARVTIHPSQFPENVRRDLLASLAKRQVNHKFHYDTTRQTQRWLALHEAFSPARTDTDCLDTYERAFNAIASRVPAKKIHLLGLGCGGGQKDTRLLNVLAAAGRNLSYTPSDVSVAMTLVARQTALSVVVDQDCFPFVCDLATADDLPSVLNSQIAAGATHLITFFGMIPNFEPEEILPRLAALVRPGDSLLFSANLAPGPDYAAGMRTILPQYDNSLTRDWLLAFLLNLGAEPGDGELRFTIETGATGLSRVIANFHFLHPRRLVVDQEEFQFNAGDVIRLFYSYRYTPELVRSHLARHGLAVDSEWITQSGQEGIFLCHRS
jgi:L-histidine N-alpha-methyltransferase